MLLHASGFSFRSSRQVTDSRPKETPGWKGRRNGLTNSIPRSKNCGALVNSALICSPVALVCGDQDVAYRRPVYAERPLEVGHGAKLATGARAKHVGRAPYRLREARGVLKRERDVRGINRAFEIRGRRYTSLAAA